MGHLQYNSQVTATSSKLIAVPFRALESNPSGMPRIVVRRSTTPSARNTAEAYPSSIAAMSTEGARGLRRRSSRASRVSDDSKLGLGTGSGSLPVSVGAAGLRGSKSFAEDQVGDMGECMCVCVCVCACAYAWACSREGAVLGRYMGMSGF